jgi:hypothetical protein
VQPDVAADGVHISYGAIAYAILGGGVGAKFKLVNIDSTQLH